MKLIQKTIAAAVLTLATLSAQAAPIITADKTTGTIERFSFLDVTYTVTDYANVSGASLLLSLDDFTGGGAERFSVTLGYGGNPQVFAEEDSNSKDLRNIASGNTDKFAFTFNQDALADLADGEVTVRISWLSGTNFLFSGSELSLTVDPVLPPEDVPEPMSLGLFAIGLLGFGAARRRMK